MKLKPLLPLSAMALSFSLIGCSESKSDDRAFFAEEVQGEKINFEDLPEMDYTLEGVRLLAVNKERDFRMGTDIKIDSTNGEITSNNCHPNEALTNTLESNALKYHTTLDLPVGVSSIFSISSGTLQLHKVAGYTFLSSTSSFDPKNCETTITEYVKGEIDLISLFATPGIERDGMGYVVASGDAAMRGSIEKIGRDLYRFNIMVENSRNSFEGRFAYKAHPLGSLTETPEVADTEETDSDDTRDSDLSDGVVVYDRDGSRRVVPEDEFRSSGSGTFNMDAYESFSTLAKSTGGDKVYAASNAAVLPDVVDEVISDVSADLIPGKPLDLAILLDATGSMGDDIAAVKKEMTRVIDQVAALKSAGYDPRIALITYKDSEAQDSDYITKIHQDFTADSELIQEMLNAINVGGGGDTPEAVFDALRDANKQLRWRAGAQRKIILIGDAPPRAKTCQAPYCGEDEILSEISSSDIRIVVYPIVTGTGY